MASNESTAEDRASKRIKGENGTFDGEDMESHDGTTSSQCENNESSQKPLTLLLDWSSRDSVMVSMNSISSALFGKTCSIHTRRELIKENHNLIKKLMALPVQSRGNRFKFFVDLTEEDETAPAKKSTGLKLKLDWSLRQNICETLFKNHHSLMYFDDTEESAKKALFEENTNLVQKLMTLEVAEQPELPCPMVKKEKDDPDASSLNGSISGVNESVLDRKLSALKEQIKEHLTKTINGRAETNYTFKIANMSQFLKLADEKKFSERMYVRNIPFFCVVQNKMKNPTPGTGHLEVFVHCDHEPKDRREDEKPFSIFLRVELKLSTNASDSKEICQSFEYTYTRRMGCGVQFFVSHADLLNTKKGYIQNDCIYVRINLVADKPTGL